MYSLLYRLDIQAFEHEVAHLFEHLMLRKLESLIEAAGIQPVIECYWKGETYSNFIFIEFTSSNTNAATIFQHLMEGSDKYDSESVDIELGRIEIEERSLLHVTDRPKLLNQLANLNTLRWVDVGHSMVRAEVSEHPRNFEEGRLVARYASAKSFRDVTIVVGIDNASPDDLALFSYLGSFVVDYIYSACNKEGLYVRASSPVFREQASNRSHALFLVITGTRRGRLTAKQLTKLLQAGLAQLARSYDMLAIQRKMKHFVRDAYYNNQPMRLYDELAVISSRAYVASLATRQNVELLFQKIELKVTPTLNGHWDRI